MSGAMRASQRGASPWQWLVILFVIAFFLTLAAKLGPLYITNYTVQSTVKALQNDPELSSKSIVEIRKQVQIQKFDVNRVEVIQAVCSVKTIPCMTIEKEKSVLRINANYETRVHIMGNVDAVVKFENNYVELPIRGGS